MHGFGVAQFSDEDDIGALAHHVLQGLLERLGISANFPLCDPGEAVLVDVLYGVFDGYDVRGPALIDVVDDCREGGGLPGPGGAAHQNQAPLLVGEGLDFFGETQLVKRECAANAPTQHTHRAPFQRLCHVRFFRVSPKGRAFCASRKIK